ncbi:MAG: RyR domain-containing protein [Bacteroidales bacterium]|nr:RyR domain-containing protein [Bacteroidales bacterium]
MSDNNHISDELLAAFLDGNTNAEDTMRVLNAAEQDMELQKIIRIASEVDEDMAITVKPTIIPMTAMAAKKKETYLCDIECEEFVLHQFGIEVTHKSLLDTAYKNCWLRDKGMPLYNIGRLLEKNNLSVSRRYNSTIEEIERLLSAGNQLIAVVDDSLLGDVLSAESQHPNHAVAISSISIEEDEIVLFNPNTEEELTKYPITLFTEAWRQSNNYLVVVNTTDKFIYDPSPIGLDDVALSDDLNELQEAIAENAHEIWAKNRCDQGWKYGLERNDQKKETPDMVPYCNLPESEKLYDREMAMQTLKLVKKLGFEIVRQKGE